MKHCVPCFALLLVGLAFGCDKRRPAPPPAENDTTTVSDPDSGTTVVSGSAVPLPDGWPKTVPVYPGATVQNALTSPGTKTLMLGTKDAPARIVDFYKALPGLKVQSDIDLGAQRVVVLENGASTVTVSLGAMGPETMVTLSVVD
jgi:hypothetical protein